jgi:S-adenosylmethionine:tRNA ribosyltransferase-isomerase
MIVKHLPPETPPLKKSIFRCYADSEMRTADFDFKLPPGLIAQSPAAKRDESRLLVLHRDSGKIAHKKFRDVREFFRAGDVLVLNNSRVIPARLRGVNAHSGGRFEILLLEENSANDWWVMLRPGKRARVGTRILFRDKRDNPSEMQATVLDTNGEGHRRLQFNGPKNILGTLESLGEIPLPPYINRKNLAHEQEDRERYQTVFAQAAGSVAAPTAGLHFTETLLDQIRSRGVQVCFVTLHVGLGTFAPVKTETLSAHKMHEERFEMSAETTRIINEAKREKRRVFAVGTTTVRVLESAAEFGVPPSGGLASRAPGPPEGGTPSEKPVQPRALTPGSGRTRIFIHPPRDFKIVDALLTNFHLPCSTLLMLVSAFAAPNETRGREVVLSAYAEAIRERYRFFSYGDAMLIL